MVMLYRWNDSPTARKAEWLYAYDATAAAV
jgi:hypothetical protein